MEKEWNYHIDTTEEKGNCENDQCDVSFFRLNRNLDYFLLNNNNNHNLRFNIRWNLFLYYNYYYHCKKTLYDNNNNGVVSAGIPSSFIF